MWICLNNAYLSIVLDNNKPGNLLVRARRKGDIERVFPDHVAITIPNRDYQFRASIPRDEVAATIATKLLGIDYDNFKDSVGDRKLHDAYASVWGVMSRVQPQRPYSDYGLRGRRKAKQPDFFGGNVEIPSWV